MLKEFIEMVCWYIVLGSMAIALLIGLAICAAEDKSECKQDLIQELCEKQLYDFCEIVEQKPIYRMKGEGDE